MNSALEGAILGELAAHHPEPVEALDMFVSIVGYYSSMERFADSLKRLTDGGLVKLTTRPGLHWTLSLTDQGLEFVQTLMDEALEIARAVGNVAEA